MSDIKKPKSSLKNHADALQRINVTRKLTVTLMCVFILLLIIIYLLTLAFSGYGSFTISVKDYGGRKYALALSENDLFKTPISRLDAKPVKEMDNITESYLPDDLNDVDGAHNGKNYLAYTFYLKNTGEAACDFKYSLIISRATLGIDAAARIRIYYNPEYYDSATGKKTYKKDYTDYAKPKTGGNGLPEIDPTNRVMTNFVSGDVIAEGVTENFKSGDVAKITIVIWLEGNDPDCTDDVLGGQLKTDMVFEIITENEV